MYLKLRNEDMGLTKLFTFFRQAIRQKGAQVAPDATTATRPEWESGIPLELAFWDIWLASGGEPWPEDFQYRSRADAPLQTHITDALAVDEGADLWVLDVGAGPLTYLGKQWAGHNLTITAIDPLADEYDTLLSKHQITPLVHTQKGFAERLVAQFGENRFDLVHARNCIDHSHDPWRAIQEMVAVAKPGGLVYMHHAVNEAQTQNFQGFHQWNLFCKAGELYVGDQRQEINVSQQLAPVADVESQLWHEGSWMINLIRKK
jgi:SAM-dependent methyltransferase